MLYPTPRRSLDERNAACASGPCARGECCDPIGCPPRDNYTGAFYRAECRDRRCIAWRYHSGG